LTISFACISTPHARDYVAGLRRIWPREIPALGPVHIVIPFAIGTCELAATAKSLNITLTTRPSHEVVLLEDLIAGILNRISNGEILGYQWVRPADDESVGREAARKHRLRGREEAPFATQTHTSEPMNREMLLSELSA
jgi:hypothetical protein